MYYDSISIRIEENKLIFKQILGNLSAELIPFPSPAWKPTDGTDLWHYVSHICACLYTEREREREREDSGDNCNSSHSQLILSASKYICLFNHVMSLLRKGTTWETKAWVGGQWIFGKWDVGVWTGLFYVAQNRNRWRALVTVVMNLRVP
jgi:hypothetical protein